MTSIKSSIIETVEQVKAGQISAVSLVQDSLQKIAKNQSYNSVLDINERALLQAEEIDARIAEGDTGGDLLGIPYLSKDNIITQDMKTTAASRILENFRAPFEASVIGRLEAAGAICVGKTNLDEFGHGSSTENSAYGVTKNPYDPQRTPGGSSGGSAAAVALGLVPFALGTDTGGSIRLPASFCGTVGYKPTYGLVSRYGVIAMASSCDVVGPLARDVADTAYVLNVIAGHDPLDATTIERDRDYTLKTPADLEGLKVGLIKEHVGENLAAPLREKVLRHVENLKARGAKVEEVSLSADAVSLAIYYIIVPAEISSNLARYDGVKYGQSFPLAKDLTETYMQTRGQGFGDEPIRRILTGTYVLSSGYQDEFYKRAQKARTLLRRDYEKVFKKYDALIGPTAPTTAFKFGDKRDPLEMYLSDDMTISANLAGVPAISIPAGEIDGLPFGLHLQAPQGQDKRLLEIAAAVEEVV